MITQLPTPPLRSDPANFSARADAFLGALPAFANEANSLEQSLQLVATTGTSTTSVSIGTGSKTLTTQTGKAWVVGSFVYVVSAASVTNMMTGQVTAYNSGTGALTVNVITATGSGTFASWVIGLAVPATAAANLSGGTTGQMPYQSAANTTAFLGAGTAGQVLRSAGAAAPTWQNPELIINEVAAAGTANALTAAFSPAITALTDGMVVYVRAALANTTTTPTLAANVTAATTIVKGNNLPLAPGDIAGPGHWLQLTYDASLARWVLANPATGVAAASTTGAGTVELATAAEAAALTDASRALTPSVLASGVAAAVNAAGTAPIFAARAWVNFNGVGTVAIRASGNVSSITDNGVGDYTINFATAMPDANYAVIGKCSNSNNNAGGYMETVQIHQNEPLAAGSVRIRTAVVTPSSSALTDELFVFAAIFR